MKDIRATLEYELEDLSRQLDLKYVNHRTKDNYNFINSLYCRLIDRDISSFDAEEEYEERKEENRLISTIIKALEYYHESH